MDSLIVYTSDSVREEDLHVFISERGGYWNRGVAVDEGVIEDGDGTLYVTSNPAFEDELEPDEVTALATRLGTLPAGAISIHIGGRDRPYAMALRIAREMAERWRGFVYEQNGELQQQ